ncbi:MAG: hypothetical protein JJT85_05510 [Chromatiales bacterium]|nr:hypothetical protein [Chromatiales bacterium]
MPVNQPIENVTDLRQRGNLLELERQLYAQWNLGRNLILAWSPQPGGVLVLVVPHYTVASYGLTATTTAPAGGQRPADPATRFIVELLSGQRQFTGRQIANAARLLEVEPQLLRLRHPLPADPSTFEQIEGLVKRYSVSFVPSRAVALFDIVGFSLLSPFEQMTQLNSLSCSLNAAYSRMLARRMRVNFARSTTGDGFYIWNRDLGLEADTSLYHFMHLVLADNAIAQHKARGHTVPVLRTCFHVGSCYEFHHAEGLNPTVYSDIVGEVTIELARMIEQAMPGQILVGEFSALAANAGYTALDAVHFIDQAQSSLMALNGLELSDEAVESIKCYLTGRAHTDGTFSVRRLRIEDKHGRVRHVFNAKVNIHRRDADPILLGVEDRYLEGQHVAELQGYRIEPDGRISLPLS